MLTDIIILIILIALAVGFIFLARAAWRGRRWFIRWPGLVLSGLLALVLTAGSVFAIIGLVRINTSPYQYPAPILHVTGAPDQVARGEKKAILCANCHSAHDALPLSGGVDDFLGGGGPPLGAEYAPNLTPGGPLKDWSDADIARAIREGVDRNGRPLFIMPSAALRNLSDEDVSALVAYLRSQPAVDHAVPPRQLSIVTTIFLGADLFPTSAQAPITAAVIAPPDGTPEKGHYLVYSMGCTDCHGLNLSGIPSGGYTPSGPNLTAIVPGWTQANLIALFRSGKDPTGRQISDVMPWMDYTEAFSDAELADIYSYLHSLQKRTTFK